MYPLMISLLEMLKKGAKALLKTLSKYNKNNALRGFHYSNRERDSLSSLSRHLQKDIGLPPYTSRFHKGNIE